MNPERRVTSYITEQGAEAYAKLLIIKKVLHGALFLFVPDLKMHELDELPKDKEYVTETKSKDEKNTYTTKFFHADKPQSIEADRAKLIVPPGWLCGIQRVSVEEKRPEPRLTATGMMNVENGAAAFHIGRTFYLAGKAALEKYAGDPAMDLKRSSDLSGLDVLLKGYAATRDEAVSDEALLTKNLTAEGRPWQGVSLN